jgi:RNA polymerase sigma-70 factor (ECF subfamily)
MNEERIGAALRAGDACALDALIGAHWARLVAYAEGVLGDRDAAYDVVQEAFVRLWEQRRKWREAGSVRVWLFRTVRNLSVSEVRRRAVRQRWEVVEGGTEHAGPRTPVQETQDRELRAAIEGAVAGLSPRRREVFTLFHLEDLTYREVAVVMGIREQTVANYLQAAVGELRKALREYFPALDGAPAGPEGSAAPAGWAAE